MEPRIELLPKLKLVGVKTKMSFVNNKTRELWQRFMPRRDEIKNAASADLYSVEIYPDTAFFKNFNPHRDFEKWAAVKVEDFISIPSEMNTLEVTDGLYAVFHYKGKPSEAQATYQYIHGNWIPNSPYQLDNRPHFALMGEKYKGEHPESEEELWIPVKK